MILEVAILDVRARAETAFEAAFAEAQPLTAERPKRTEAGRRKPAFSKTILLGKRQRPRFRRSRVVRIRSGSSRCREECSAECRS